LRAGGWALGAGPQPPNPQAPIPNPQSPIKFLLINKSTLKFKNKIIKLIKNKFVNSFLV
jgi:hypothetical protein